METVEWSFSDILGDPLIRLVMAADNVSQADIEKMLRTLAKNQRDLNGRSAIKEDHFVGRHRPSERGSQFKRSH
ncbi:hypothetical protein DOU54_13690 [Agrobacterium sp. MS2]|jgi:hypothetical protein|nr:hypothetical protein DOU54_13690 [Agrobacterium sp. MS2]